MQIQYVSRYFALAEEGSVDRINCPIDQGLLLPNLDYDDSIFLYCLSCGYKKIIGISLYEEIVKKVLENDNR